MNKVWEELCTGDCSLSINPSSQLDRQLLQQSRLITQKMDLLEESLASVQSSVSSLHRTLPTYVRYEIKLDRLEQIISNIWGTYNLLEFYQVNNDTILNSVQGEYSGEQADSGASHSRGLCPLRDLAQGGLHHDPAEVTAQPRGARGWSDLQHWDTGQPGLQGQGESLSEGRVTLSGMMMM